MDAEQILRELQDAIGNSSGAMSESAKKFADMISQISGQASFSVGEMTDTVEHVSKAMTNLSVPLLLLGRRTGQLTAAMYGAEGAFSSTERILSEMSTRLQEKILLLGRLGGTFPSLGKATEGLARIFNFGISVVSDTLSFQLNAAQKVADTFFSITKSGATFGGRISELSRDTLGTGISMKEYSKIVQENLENISKFGIGIEQGAVLLAGFAGQILYGIKGNTEATRRINNVNESLIMMYGGIDELSKGISDFLVLQAQEGQNLRQRNIQELLLNGTISEYLVRQKELSTITGKRVDELRKEEEARRMNLDYALKIGRLGDDAKNNLTESMAVIGKIFGTSAIKYAEEYFATGGKVLTQTSLEYEAANTEATRAIMQMIGSINQAPQEFRQAYMAYLQSNAPALEQFARAQEDLAEVNRAANSKIIATMTETSSAILANLTLIKNGTDLAAEAARVRSQIESGLDAQGRGYIEAERQRQKNQGLIDQMVVENMSKMGQMVATLNQVQQLYIEVQNNAFKQISGVIDAMGGFKDGLVGLVDFFQKSMVVLGVSTPAGTGSPQGPQIERADGGLTYGPTTVGEDGTEAVIPLKGGKIPLEIDLQPLVTVMSKQVEMTSELIERVKDSVDVQERILNASY